MDKHPDPRVMSRRERIALAQRTAQPQPQAQAQAQNEAQHKGPQIDLKALQMMAMIQALRRRARPPNNALME